MTKPPSKTTVLKCVSGEVGRKLPADPDELRQVLRDAVDACTLQEPEPTRYTPRSRIEQGEKWGIDPTTTPTREEFYSQEYWYDPKRGLHPASGSGRLPSKQYAQIEIREVGGEQAIRIYNPWTKEEIYYYDLNQMDEAKERFKNLYAETFGTEAEPTYKPRQPPSGSGLQMQASLEGGGGQTYFAGSSTQRRGKIAAKRTPRKRAKKGSGSLAMFGVMPEGQTTL